MKCILFIFSIFLLNSCVPLDQQGSGTGTKTTQTFATKPLRTEDFVYESNIKTVLLYQFTGGRNDAVLSPIIPINQATPLLLEFDELGQANHNYYAKIVHCNSDWNPSTLTSIQYLSDYNEYPINDKLNSNATRTPYIHYKFLVPRVKISGNYLVVVYRNYNDQDIIITRRFTVYENALQINPQIRYSTGISERAVNQQVDFLIDYKSYNLINPRENLKMVIRQNYRWDNALTQLKPVFVREELRQFDYTYFDLANNFPGGNEFRSFDIRSTKFNGFNVDRIVLEKDKTEIVLLEDGSKGREAYTTFQDVDGKYVVEHYETGGRETDPDYVYVTFTLNVPKADGEVYIIGALNDYRLTTEYKMTYDEVLKKYKRRILLKQGYYNFRYALQESASKILNEVYFEGSHAGTQNYYEIIAYYRLPGTRNDLVIGYNGMNYMGR